MTELVSASGSSPKFDFLSLINSFSTLESVPDYLGDIVDNRESLLDCLISEAFFLDEVDLEEEDAATVASALAFVRSLGPLSSKAGEIVDMHFRNGIDTCFRLPGKPCAMDNPDSLCYMTSVLELLSSVRPFATAVLQASWGEEESILNEVAKVYALKTNSLHCKTGITDVFDRFRDEYPSEFVTVEASRDASAFLADLVGVVRRCKRTELIESFYGTLKNSSTGSTERFATLPLGVKNGSLLPSLDDFFTGQRLDDGSPIILQMEKAPQYIIFQLKRFSFDRKRASYSKVDGLFDFPERVDLSPYVCAAGDRQLCAYNLAGVVVHEGTVSDGHYYSFVKKHRTSAGAGEFCWHCINDSSVSKMSPAAATATATAAAAAAGFSKVYEQSCGGKDGASNAFLLLYESEEEEGGTDPVTLSADLAEMVEERNERLCAEAILGIHPV
jgi:hypothetical protein